MIESLKIIGLCILAAIAYGIVQDQITARICIEYFTIGHPPIFGDTESPTLLACGWGVIATWWVGLPLGILLAVCSQLGASPKRKSRDLVKPIAGMLLILLLLAMTCAAMGYLLATWHWVWLSEPLASMVPTGSQNRFLADLWAHLASYIFGAIFGIAFSIQTLVIRYRRYLQHLSSSL